MKVIRAIGLAFLLLLGMAACSSPFSDDEAEARIQLLNIAPVGSDARNALPILEEKGFTCKWVRRQEFVGATGKRDYLYCDMERSTGIVQRWQLALFHNGYVVTDAKFSIGRVAP